MKQTNNVILTKICNNSRYFINLYFNCIINLKHIYIYIYIYIKTEQVTNKINQYTYTKTVTNKTYQ